MEKNPKILYWKWDEHIASKIQFGLHDCLARFDFDLLYLSFHHLPLPFTSPEMQSLIRVAVSELSAHGKKVLLDIDARNELKAFLSQYPDGEGMSARLLSRPLDENGYAQITLPNPSPGRTGRAGSFRPVARIAGAWVFAPSGKNRYVSGSLSRLDTGAVTVKDQYTESVYHINAGVEHAGKQVILIPLYNHGIPDLFSPDLDTFNESLFDAVADLPLGGAATDEWGYDISLRNDDGLFYVDALPYSPGMARRYAEKSGRSLEDDFIHLAYAPDGGSELSLAIACATDYLSVLRGRMEENNRWFYQETKRRFGQNAFVGVHPTLWGDPADFSLDILHNGICWWETPRDYAQTDEFVAMPIRTALAHKWGGAVFYNMWYSGNTQQPDTYWRETWDNARFGGRTHYLGYECPNEPGVYRLKHPGGLEGVDAMEKKISEIDRLQQSQPDCRVLIVFGMEAISNWYFSGNGPLTVRGGGLIPDVVHYALCLFETFLCDLVPSTEITNGSVILSQGEARYGTQQYDAVIYVATEGMDRIALDLLTQYSLDGGKLMVAGTCSYYNDGLPMDDGFKRLINAAAYYFPDAVTPPILDTVRILREWRVPCNRWHNGCVYQDGSLLFTANGIKPTGNFLEVDCVYGNRQIRFTGEDYYYVSGNPHGEN